MFKRLGLVLVISFLFSNTVLAQQVGPNINVGPSAEGSIAINPTDSSNLTASSNFNLFFSLNNGQTWGNSVIGTLPDSFGQDGDANVAFDSLGNVYRQVLDFVDSTHIGMSLWKSTDKGQTYPSTQGSWAYRDLNGHADMPYMAIDIQPTSPFKDNIYVTWWDSGNPTLGNQLIGNKLLFTRSTNHGATFSTPIDISKNTSVGADVSPYITTGPNGEIYVVWINNFLGVLFNKSLDGGLTWGTTDVQVNQFPNALQCSNSSLLSTDVINRNPTVSVDRSNGPFRGYIYVSSIFNNTCSSGGVDAWVARSTDGGNTWSSSVLLSDGLRAPYKYYFQPRISVAPNGRVDATWYDTRFNTSTDTNNVTYDVFYTYSLDGGLTFKPNNRVTNVSSVKVTHCGTQGPCAERVLFEYIGLASDNSRAFPLWTDLRQGSDPPVQRQFTAQITNPTFNLTVAKAGTGSGTVTSSPAGINCGATCQALFNSGQVVTLTAASSGGSTFAGFSGGCISSTTTCTFTITANTTVTATFNDTQAPTVPAGLIATTVSATQINLLWNPSSDNIGVNHYEVRRSFNNSAYVLLSPNPTTASFTDTTVSAGITYLYKVRAVDGAGNVSADSIINYATTIVFSEALVATQTTVKAQHITELRTAVNAVRRSAGLTQFTAWTDANLQIGITTIKAAHIQELRDKLNEARTATSLGLTALSFTDPTLTPPGSTVVKKVHIDELRQGVKGK